jgi:hypothetical protein
LTEANIDIQRWRSKCCMMFSVALRPKCCI